MKVLSAQEMARIEKLAFADGYLGSHFMEKAGQGIAKVVSEFCAQNNISTHLTLFAGKGNNGGDGYVAAHILASKGFMISVQQIGDFSDCSALCQKYGRAWQQGGGEIHFVHSIMDIKLPSQGIILDGLLGTGFSGKLSGLLLAVVEQLNTSSLPIISIDIPSGLDGNTGIVESLAVRAVMTIYLGSPKLGFFVESGWEYVGALQQVFFGLPEVYFQKAHSELEMLTLDDIKRLVPAINRMQNKYSAGFVVGIAGFLGMVGSALLSGKAALRSGAGILHLFQHENNSSDLSLHTPELVVKKYLPKYLDPFLLALEKASGIYIGPGLGMSTDAKSVIQLVFKQAKKPLVIDADALNIMATENFVPPKSSILTPHLGELARLLNRKLHDVPQMEILMLGKQYAICHKIILVIKGPITFIIDSAGVIFVSNMGDSGMATAGSGDVLTGMIAAFLSRGLKPLDAAKVGVYLHGMAGKLAAFDKTSPSLMASDIIEYIPKALAYFYPQYKLPNS